MQMDRTPTEFLAYVKGLEELAWWAVGSTEEYEQLMEEGKLDQLSYLQALERLILKKNGGAD